MTALEAILAVFTAAGEWITEALVALIPIFWAEGTGLTFLGVLAVASLAFSVTFLIIGIIEKFLKFRS